MTDATIVCILGMHRSGTSVLSRLLNILGVHLGLKERLLQPQADNPKGFWEHTLIQEINDEILVAAGGCWHEPPDFPEGWERSANYRKLRLRAEIIIRDEFGRMPVWGWKDPRTCLTLPFWQQILPPLSYVICLRHPMDVARSLQHRDGFSIEKGIYLWLSYLKAVLLNTPKDTRHVVLYEELIRNAQIELKRLAEFLGIAERASQRSVLDKVSAFVDKDLRHHSSRLLNAQQDSETSSVFQALTIAEDIYSIFIQQLPSELDALEERLEITMGLLRPVVRVQNTEKKDREEKKWNRYSRKLTQEIEATMPPGNTFILVDEARLELNKDITDRRVVPFLECDGVYWGRPDNDEMAIEELERMQRQGASHIVFAWPAFWWLDHYSEFHQYLRTKCQCLLKNDCFVVFKLGPG